MLAFLPSSFKRKAFCFWFSLLKFFGGKIVRFFWQLLLCFSAQYCQIMAGHWFLNTNIDAYCNTGDQMRPELKCRGWAAGWGMATTHGPGACVIPLLFWSQDSHAWCMPCPPELWHSNTLFLQSGFLSGRKIELNVGMMWWNSGTGATSWDQTWWPNGSLGLEIFNSLWVLFCPQQS